MQIHRTADQDYYGSHPKDLEHMNEVNEATGLKTSTYVLGDPMDETATTAALIFYPPNWILPRHTHACERLEVIIEGSVEAGGQVLGPGDIMMASEGELYGPHQIGPEGCKTLEVFGNRRGYHWLTFETPDGTVQTIDIASENAVEVLAAADSLSTAG